MQTYLKVICTSGSRTSEHEVSLMVYAQKCTTPIGPVGTLVRKAKMEPDYVMGYHPVDPNWQVVVPAYAKEINSNVFSGIQTRYLEECLEVGYRELTLTSSMVECFPDSEVRKLIDLHHWPVSAQIYKHTKNGGLYQLVAELPTYLPGTCVAGTITRDSNDRLAYQLAENAECTIRKRHHKYLTWGYMEYVDYRCLSPVENIRSVYRKLFSADYGENGAPSRARLIEFDCDDDL